MTENENKILDRVFSYTLETVPAVPISCTYHICSICSIYYAWYTTAPCDIKPPISVTCPLVMGNMETNRHQCIYKTGYFIENTKCYTTNANYIDFQVALSDGNISSFTCRCKPVALRVPRMLNSSNIFHQWTQC